MIVTVGNTKGGVGKTTLALNIAIARAMLGKEVWLIDGDRQKTSLTAISIRSDSGKKPEIACANYSDGRTLLSQVKLQQPKFEDIIIDVGGQDSSAFRAALMITDVLIVPIQPRSFDVWSLENIGVLIGEARSVRNGLRTCVLLNLADPGKSLDNVQAIEILKNIGELEYINTIICKRKAFSNAAGQGLSVLEVKPPDKKAVEELKTLLFAVYSE
ncbi:Partitioning protein, ParA [Gammaproteobacteria bacterium]